MGADSEIGMLNSLRVRAMLSAQHVNELVVAAIGNSWETIRAHKDVMRNVTELILRDGIEAGEFEPVDPRETAELIMRSVVVFTHPLLVGRMWSVIKNK